MGAGHSHAKPGAANERRLQLALAFTGSFLIVEVVGGVLAGSLALISSAHVVLDPMERTDGKVVPVIRAMLHERFSIRHSTIQCEREPCEDADGHHQYI